MFKKWFSKIDNDKFKALDEGIAELDKSLAQLASSTKTISTAPNYFIGGIGQSASSFNTSYTATAGLATSSFTVGTNLHNSSTVVSFSKPAGAEIVRLNTDGTITWGNGIDIDEAAEAFGRAVKLGAEMQSGISRGVKHRMRDSVFADIIAIAKEKGSLTAEDLTYLLEASKIVEKLKGSRE